MSEQEEIIQLKAELEAARGTIFDLAEKVYNRTQEKAEAIQDMKAWRDLAERMKAYWDEGNQDSLGKIFVDLERLRLESEP